MIVKAKSYGTIKLHCLQRDGALNFHTTSV